jgi:hypothetical protein
VWADDVIERLGLPRALFPNVHASEEVVGVLSQEAAKSRKPQTIIMERTDGNPSRLQ